MLELDGKYWMYYSTFDEIRSKHVVLLAIGPEGKC